MNQNYYKTIILIFYSLIPLQLVNAESSSIKSYAPSIPVQVRTKSPPACIPMPTIPKKVQPGWTICNKSSEPKVWVAYSHYDGSVWANRGWIEIKCNECSRILPSLDNRYIYYYAQGKTGEWTGNMKKCVHPINKFTFIGKICPNDYELYRFREIDVGNSTAYTTTLTE